MTLNVQPYQSDPPVAYRGHARVFLKDLEAVRPSAIIDIIHSGETFMLGQTVQRNLKSLRQLLAECLLGP